MNGNETYSICKKNTEAFESFNAFESEVKPRSVVFNAVIQYHELMKRVICIRLVVRIRDREVPGKR